jgi:hypothetical protein
MANEFQSIIVEYDNDEFAMYGSNGAEGYDQEASCNKYESLLTAALESAYPGVDVTVTTGYGRVKVDGDTAHDEVDSVNAIINRVWQSWGWMVEA